MALLTYVKGLPGYLARKAFYGLKRAFRRRTPRELAHVDMAEQMFESMIEPLIACMTGSDPAACLREGFAAQIGRMREEALYTIARREGGLDIYVNGGVFPYAPDRQVQLSELSERIISSISPQNGSEPHADYRGRARAARDSLEDLLSMGGMRVEVSVTPPSDLEEVVINALAAYEAGIRDANQHTLPDHAEQPLFMDTADEYLPGGWLEHKPFYDEVQKKARELIKTSYRKSRTLEGNLNSILARRNLPRQVKAILMSYVVRRTIAEGGTVPRDLASSIQRVNNYVAKYGKHLKDALLIRIAYKEAAGGRVLRLYQKGIVQVTDRGAFREPEATYAFRPVRWALEKAGANGKEARRGKKVKQQRKK